MQLNINQNMKFDQKTNSVIIYNCPEIFDILRDIEDNHNIDSICIFLENKNYSEDEMRILHRMRDREINVQINCEGDLISLDDFETVRSSMNFFVEVVKSLQLSPLEELMYVYDIVKSFVYKKETVEEQKNITTSSRNLIGIIKSGNITCFGYAKLFVQILKELGHKVFSGGVYCPSSFDEEVSALVDDELLNHERIIMYINDEKYGYSSWFCSDPSWEGNSLNINQIIHYYRYFIVPFSMYHYIFENNSKPNCVQYFSNLSMEDRKILGEFISSNNDNDFTNSLHSKSLDMETFIKVVSEVRRNQGYSEEEIAKLIDNYRYEYQLDFPRTV